MKNIVYKSPYSPVRTKVAALQKNRTSAATRTEAALARSYSKKVLKDSKRKYGDNLDILALFPEILQAAKIRTAFITSPSTFGEVYLNYSLKQTIPAPKLVTGFLNIVKDIDTRANVSDEIDDIIMDILSGSGGTLKILLPQSVVDKTVFGLSDNTLKKDKLLDLVRKNTSDQISLESITDDIYKDVNVSNEELNSLMNITTSLDELKLTNVSRQTTRVEDENAFNTIALEGISDIISTGETSSVDVTNADPDIIKAMFDTLNNTKNGKRNPLGENIIGMLKLSPDTGDGISGVYGDTLIRTVKNDAVTVIHAPGNPEARIGYLVSITEGFSKTPTTRSGHSSKLSKRDMKNDFLVTSRAKLENMTKDTTDNGAQRKLFMKFTMATLKETLRSKTGNDISIASNPEFFDMLFSRALSKTKTKLVYVPAAIATYFILDTRPNGSGKTALEDVMPLLSLRASMLMSETMSKLKANAGRTEVRVTLDPKTPNVKQALTEIEAVIHSSNKLRFPGAVTNIADLADWVGGLGYQVHISGHPDLPSTEIEYEHIRNDMPEPDQEFNDKLEKKTYKALGVLPSLIDDGFDNKFASSSEANRLLTFKTAAKDRKKINKSITDFHVKYFRLNQSTRKAFAKIIEDNTKEVKALLGDAYKKFSKDKETLSSTILHILLNLLLVELPKDESIKDYIGEEYQNVLGTITSLVTEVYVTEDNVSSIVDKMVELHPDSEDETLDIDLSSIQSSIITHYMKRWLAKKQFYPELFELDEADSDAMHNSVGKLISSDTEELATILETIIKARVKSVNKRIKKANPEPEPQAQAEPEPDKGGPAPADNSGGDDLGF